MRIISVSVYYNEDFGYVFTSTTTIKGSIVNVVMNPAATLSKNADACEIGNEIFTGLEKSEKAKPLESSEALQYKFWQITKIKSFTSFSKKFRCVNIQKVSNGYEIQELQLEKSAGVVWHFI